MIMWMKKRETPRTKRKRSWSGMRMRRKTWEKIFFERFRVDLV